jgi:hypothetical protein
MRGGWTYFFKMLEKVGRGARSLGGFHIGLNFFPYRKRFGIMCSTQKII